MVRKLLIIDDDNDDREFFCEAIEAIDEQIVCYAEINGRKALENLDSEKIENPDVIFLDVNMPLMDGWECLRRLKSKESYKSIPVIMYSTTSNTEDLEKAHLMGAISFLVKPSDIKSLKKSLEVAIDHLNTGSLQTLQNGSLFLIPSH